MLWFALLLFRHLHSYYTAFSQLLILPILRLCPLVMLQLCTNRVVAVYNHPDRTGCLPCLVYLSPALF